MGRDKKRLCEEEEEGESSSSSKVDPYKKPCSSSASNYQANNGIPRQDSNQQKMGKHSNFISYIEVPNLPPKIKLLCEILANTPSASVERMLEDTGIRVSQEDVQEVLKLSYGFPGPAVKFFRWSGFHLNDNHSPYAWNLVVDLLGKNGLFDAMWDAIKSMRKEKLLSLATFASVFSSYAMSNRVEDAFLAFEIMDQYGCPRDTIALNSLLSALCMEGKTQQAKGVFRNAKKMVRPDADSYAILLEGWEKESDWGSARQTFSEMVADIGWNPGNVPAYDSFLTTLLKGPDGMQEALKYFKNMKERGCFPGMKFFKVAIDDCVRKNDTKSAALIWQEMNGKNGCKPDTGMYNSMIVLHCKLKDYDFAKTLLDGMVYNGVFPNSETYNIFFHFLVKSRRLKEASLIFVEMVKNEFVPSHLNCCSAVRTYMQNGDTYMAIKVWKCMIENYSFDLEETGNLLIVGLRDINRVQEAVKYAEDMIDRGIKLDDSTLSKLKQSLCRIGKAPVYEELLRKWKTCYC
ncbi:hypothetical protein M9H77_05596 [Catharanthus roseus]|uniref:Uncharacterized protein n=1 Tax=Catharanthus roseus TaxID=4058 RepID=A0ACC0CHC4_CATRO|nr:hypothetical protein M9H77_05596 [Catharanthus roseus]